MSIELPESVVEGALRGERVSVAELTARVRPLIERQLVRYAFSRDDRDDVVQATMLQLIKHLPSFRGDANFSTWIFRVTANEALMLLRRHKRMRARLSSSEEYEELCETTVSGQDLDERATTRQRDASVQTALAELPEEYRDVVVAHYHLDLGLNEIAERLELTESAVRSRLHRARARLRTLLESEHAAQLQ